MRLRASVLRDGRLLVLTVQEGLQLRDKALISVVCVAIIAAVSLSRVYLGVHYLGDVLGGWLLGSAIMTATTGVYILKTSVAKGES